MQRGQASAAGSKEKGKWVWQEETKQLVFEREEKWSRRRTKPWLTTLANLAKVTLPAATTTGCEDEDRRVTLEDIKSVAVGLISKSLVRKMHKNTAMLFDACYRTEHMNAFLWATLLYFDAFHQHNLAEEDENIAVPGVLGENAREVLKKREESLSQARVNLGEAYSFLILGMGHRDSHHSQQGRLKVSRTLTDQDLYEAIYEFAMYVTWVTFSYQHWEIIHREFGRLFKTPAFNRDLPANSKSVCIEVEGFGRISRDSDEYLSYRTYYDRPPVGSLNRMYSPALAGFFPSPKETYSWAFKPPYKPSTRLQQRFLPNFESLPERLGVIGELMSKVNPETLKYFVSQSDCKSDCESDELSESTSEEADSDTSEIQEEEGSEVSYDSSTTNKTTL